MKSRPERLSKRSGLPLREGCCSLKIRRVESALLMESEHASFGVACEHRAISNALIASTDFNRESAGCGAIRDQAETSWKVRRT
jgi:hypothetical protein